MIILNLTIVKCYGLANMFSKYIMIICFYVHQLVVMTMVNGIHFFKLDDDLYIVILHLKTGRLYIKFRFSMDK